MLDANGVEIVEPVIPAVPVEPAAPAVIPAAEPPVLPEPIAEKPKPASTGNEFFDSVQDVMHEKGIAPEKYWEEVYSTGVLTAESRVELVAALGESQVRLIEGGITSEITKLKTGQAAAAQAVYDTVNLPGYTDGKAAFSVLAEFAKTGCTEEERNTYNTMLKVGGVQAALAVKAIKEKYMSDPNYTQAASLEQGTTVPLGQGPELISRAAYTTAIRKAERDRDGVAMKSLRERANYTMQNNAGAWRP